MVDTDMCYCGEVLIFLQYSLKYSFTINLSYNVAACMCSDFDQLYLQNCKFLGISLIISGTIH